MLAANQQERSVRQHQEALLQWRTTCAIPVPRCEDPVQERARYERRHEDSPPDEHETGG